MFEYRSLLSHTSWRSLRSKCSYLLCQLQNNLAEMLNQILECGSTAQGISEDLLLRRFVWCEVCSRNRRQLCARGGCDCCKYLKSIWILTGRFVLSLYQQHPGNEESQDGLAHPFGCSISDVGWEQRSEL